MDIILAGGTGFVGRLTAEYLAAHAPAGTRVGLAGRNPVRLAAVRDALPGADGWPLLAADLNDPADAARVAAAAPVVVSTVGPYDRLGRPLAAACARAGADYLDLTGEVLFHRWSVAHLDAIAAGTGARLVHSCGFDSVPSDMAVAELAAAAPGELATVELVVEELVGGVSGGTVASLRGQLAAMRADPAARAIVDDPWALAPAAPADHRTRRPVRVAPGPRGRLAPFFMAPYNTRLVRRSAMLAGYGGRFDYAERLRVRSPARALAVRAGLAAGAAALYFPPTARLLARRLPAPGEGPTAAERARGRFRMRAHARTRTGARLAATVALDRDPGYEGTALMLGEAALTLLLDRDRLPAAAGALTPATGLGAPYADRLRAAGMTLMAHP
ncbi:hypothetical protein CSPHI_00480 [Corynebacterium sphenisci DSM 44792]|uniref:Saccharopine dehydrogenase NADP binding domain-containing protein n=1 Tax=Corynebacterium sphenisci DSM 44792 TaxID=1437874 RepID=A0A1L7CVH8_9CORY|nr:saccharopine dehydrogenase NADP-binding domain-containing protein [Corynebacterium sphenisci]APT89818.1 hypothetical protein CSPHI_00480 [Corynebacterium sphenisci DSM 44792]